MSGSGIKKTIIISSSILFILILLHLIGVYIFAGGHYEGVKGGSISIGIVDTTPNPLNPFEYGKDDSTDLVYRFLFRGLVRYDIGSWVYTGDLTSCDLTDMTIIRCTLKDDAVWSDATRIKTDDIVSSIDMFRKRAPNKDIRRFLETVTVTKNGDTVELRSTQRSPHMIDILTYPIIRSDIIEKTRSGSIDKQNYVTSGPYIFSEIVTDKEYGFDRITLVRNEKWRKSTWLDKIHFKFFKDLPSLERSTETLTIIIPPIKNEKLEIGPRFREYLYTNYEYFSVFLNTKSMSKILRNSLHWQIWTYFSENIIDDHKRVNSIFASGGALLPTENLKWFPDILRELGYSKKSEMISKLQQSTTTVSGEVVYIPAKYWTNKANATTLFISDPITELLLTGNIPSNTISVNINGYTLKEFIPGNTTFTYKVNTLSGTLLPWKNIYTLTLQQKEWKTDTESLIVYLTSDISKMTEYKKQVQEDYNKTQNTAALIASRERTKEEKLKQLQTLRDEYYYNDKNEVFTIKIGYVVGPQSTETYANSINEALLLLGVKTELLPYGTKEIQAMIVSGKHVYDLLVIGVSIEGSISGIGQLFTINESKQGGVNFSNVENKTLDSLFMELRGTTEASKLGKIEQSIAKIMNTESFFVPISSPYHRIWVDRNIKGMPSVEIIPDIASFVGIFVGTSIKENYIRNTTNKDISGFLTWIISKL